MKTKNIKNPDFKLPAATKKKWVKALRSGKYKQGCGRLYDSGSECYCCLGVLENILGMESSKMFDAGLPHNLGRKSKSPKVLRETEEHIFENPANLVAHLVDMNDNKNYSFKKIATWIEKNC